MEVVQEKPSSIVLPCSRAKVGQEVPTMAHPIPMTLSVYNYLATSEDGRVIWAVMPLVRFFVVLRRVQQHWTIAVLAGVRCVR